jgi:DNA-binding GntR family transcriptional regulator
MTARAIVQRERLRDQVYNLIREELKAGKMVPGQRIVEADMAERYGVSRTPVREALFQLARDGLLTGNERGYIVPVDTRRAVADRLEVRFLLEPHVVRHVALQSSSEQLKTLAKVLEKEKAAHETDKYNAFVDANYQFRTIMRSMCQNELLARCSALVDDQFQTARNRIHRSAENRRIGLEYDIDLFASFEARDADKAERLTRDFLDKLRVYFDAHPTGD